MIFCARAGRSGHYFIFHYGLCLLPGMFDERACVLFDLFNVVLHLARGFRDPRRRVLDLLIGL
jgi:hypothetical protein